MRLAIIGSRNSQNCTVDDVVSHIPTGVTLVISGGAAGIDSLAEAAAKRCGIPFRKILPDYKKYGKSAPSVRNIEIVNLADEVLAFWDYQSRGTAFVIAACIKRHVPVDVVELH